MQREKPLLMRLYQQPALYETEHQRLRLERRQQRRERKRPACCNARMVHRWISRTQVRNYVRHAASGISGHSGSCVGKRAESWCLDPGSGMLSRRVL
jgi:hypothetical protein